MSTLNTTNWTVYPFEVDGVQFNSLIKPNTKMAKQIASLPAGVFNQMNIGAVRECIGNVATMTHSELVAELESVNAGASEAVIALA